VTLAPGTERWRNETYLRWVASLPCSACRTEENVQAHHFKGTGHLSGAALKAPDYWTMPLCCECHEHVHRSKSKADYERQWEWVARTMGKWFALQCAALGNETMNTLVKGVARGEVIGGHV